LSGSGGNGGLQEYLKWCMKQLFWIQYSLRFFERKEGDRGERGVGWVETGREEEFGIKIQNN
jgi:hypothetical protein